LFAAETWRSTVIQLYSFSKSYAIPGHRTGAITADAGLVDQIAKILDCIQICAPRTAQAALPWAINALREWREANRADINHRAEVFRQALAPWPDWRIDSAGAYFAYLRHPFPGRSAQAVAERLAVERGVLCLPGSYFGPGQESHLRVAFANVDAEVLAVLTERLGGFAL
jgi:aspartate/methionine/tyrosine aminotransferase